MNEITISCTSHSKVREVCFQEFDTTGCFKGGRGVVVVLNGDKLRQHFEEHDNGTGVLIPNSGKLQSWLDRANECPEGVLTIEMPLYNIKGSKLVVEGGRHRTYLLLSFLGLAQVAAIVPESTAADFEARWG